jgi:hypothetical protein
MQNLTMAEKLRNLSAIDVRVEGQEVGDGVFQLPRFVQGADYCDSKTERWIWSIGKDFKGRVFAAVDTRYYGDPNYDCLFLR